MLGPRGWAFLLAAVALLIRAPLIVSAHTASAPDTFDYFKIASGLHHGQLLIDGFRTPGYPVVIFLLDLVPGRREDALGVFQHLAGVAAVAGIVLVAWRYFGRAPSLTAGALAAATPVMVGSEHQMVPDFLFGLVACTGAVLLAEAIVRTPAAGRWFVVAGVVFGASAYLKPTGLFLIAAAPIALILSRAGIRSTVRGSALVTVALLLTISPWVVRNGLVLGHWTMSIQGGQTLFKRVFDVDHRPTPTGTPEDRLVRRFDYERRANGSKVELNEFVSDELQRRGYSTYQIVSLERRVALQAIKAAPGLYAARTFEHTGKFLIDDADYLPKDLTEEEARGGLGAGHRKGGLELGEVAWVYIALAVNLVWLGLALGGVAMLLPLRAQSRLSRIAAAAFVAAWFAVAFGTAASHGGLRRYSAEVVALLWITGSAGAIIVVAQLRQSLQALKSATFLKRLLARLS
jgi:4-amino-4-deoxy-L-arabinose transferase-like glycosyltransferase